MALQRVGGQQEQDTQVIKDKGEGAAGEVRPGDGVHI